MAAKQLAESAIADNKIAIFSKSWCPYCARVKQLLHARFPEIEAKILELDEIENGAEIQNYLKGKTGQGTVPNVFINQKHVGGCDAVTALDNQGRLSSLVKA